MNLDQMVIYLQEAIQFQTAVDIIDFPDHRLEFQPYIKRCIDHVPKAAVPYVVLVMLIEEQNSILNRIRRLFK